MKRVSDKFCDFTEEMLQMCYNLQENIGRHIKGIWLNALDRWERLYYSGLWQNREESPFGFKGGTLSYMCKKDSRITTRELSSLGEGRLKMLVSIVS